MARGNPKIRLSVEHQAAIQAFVQTGNATKDLKKALAALGDEIKKTGPVSAADKAYSSFERTVNKLASEIRGNGATAGLNQIAHAIEKIGGAGKLTEIQLDNVRKKIESLKAAGGTLPKELAALDGLGAGASIRGLVDDVAMQRASGLGALGPALAQIGPQGLAVAASLGAVATALGTVTALTAKFAATGGALADMEARLAIPAQAIQELGFAAEQAGVDFGAITTGVERMAVALVETPEKFDAIKLSAADLLAMRPDEQFYAVAEAIRGIENPTLQAHAAMEIFGKGGAQLLPLIRQGVAGLAEEAQRLGFVMDREMVAAADALDDATNALSKSWDGLMVSFGGVIGQSPALVQAIGDIATIIGVLSKAIKSLPSVVITPNVHASLLALAVLAQKTAGAEKAGRDLVQALALARTGAASQAQGSNTDFESNRTTETSPETRAAWAAFGKQQDEEWERATKAAEAAAKKNEEIANRNAAMEQKANADMLQRARAAQEALEKLKVDYANRGIAEGVRAGDAAAKQAQETAEAEKRILADRAENVRTVEQETAAIIADAAAAKMSATDREIASIEAWRVAEQAKLDKLAALPLLTKKAAEEIDKAREAIDKMAESEKRAAAQAALIKHLGDVRDILGEVVNVLDAFGVSAESELGQAARAAVDLAGALESAAKAGAAYASGDFFGAAIEGLKALGGLVRTLRSDSTASRAMAGFLIGGPVGAAIAASIKPETQKVAEYLAQEFGKKFSDELVKQIAADSKRLGDRVAATLKNLGAIIAEAGGVEKFGVDKSISKLRDLFSAVERGQLTVKEAGETFDEVFGELIPHALDKTTGIARADFLELIALQQRFGLESKEAEGYLRAQSEAGLAGLKLFLDNAAVTVPGAALAIGAALAKALDDGLRSGRPMHEVLGELKPMVDQFAQQLAEAGLSGGAAFDALNSKVALFSDEVAGPALRGVAGLSAFMVATFNQGLLTKEAFAGLAAQVTETRQRLIDEGHSAEEINGAMQQDLQRIWELKRRTGYEVDANTQKLLSEAETAGLVGEQYMSAGERLVAGIDRLNDTLEEALRFIGLLPAAANSAADGMNSAFGRVGGPRYSPGETPDYRGWSEPDLRPFARGGADYFDRAGESVKVHGPEVIAPSGDHSSAVVRELAGTLADLIGGRGSETQVIQVVVDGDVVATATARAMERGGPGGRRLQAAQRRG